MFQDNATAIPPGIESEPPRHLSNESLRPTEQQTQQQTSHSYEKQRKLATLLYLLTTSLLFGDQNLLAPNLSAIATEFNFNDIERDTKLGGDIAIAFFMVGVPASFLVGCLADITNKRSLLFLWVILIGEGACMATYWVKTYKQLYWCRALTGCSVGGALPLIYSVLGDYYEPKERGWVSGAISMGCGIGISLGQGFAGILGPRFGWRIPFLVVSFPAMICALGVWMCISEVERGAGEKRLMKKSREDDKEIRLTKRGGGEEELEMPGRMVGERLAGCQSNNSDEEGILNDNENENSCKLRRDSNIKNTGDTTIHGHYVQLKHHNSADSTTAQSPTTGTARCYIVKFYKNTIHPHIETTKTLLRCPSVVLAIFQGAPGCVPWGIVNTYLNDYLSSDRGMSVEGATLIILIFGLGNFVGVTLGGVGSTYLYTNYGPRYPSLLSGSAAMVGCIPMWMLLNYNFNSSNGNFENDTLADNNSDISNTTTASLVILSIISFVAGIMSGVTGPIVKSTLQNVTLPQMRGQAFALLNTFDDFGRGLGPAFVARMIENMGGRRKAFNVGIVGWILCGILNSVLFWTVERDEEKVRLGVEELVRSEGGEGVEADQGDVESENEREMFIEDTLTNINAEHPSSLHDWGEADDAARSEVPPIQ